MSLPCAKCRKIAEEEFNKLANFFPKCAVVKYEVRCRFHFFKLLTSCDNIFISFNFSIFQHV